VTTQPEAAAIQSILALTDLSAQAEHALSRAALLAAAHGARVRFMHLANRSDSPYTDPQARLMQRCRALGRQHNIAVESIDSTEPTLKRVLAQAQPSDLVVIHRSQNVKPGAFLKRTAVDQLLHDTRCPVLVVNRPVSEPYRHVLVAADLTDGTAALLRLGCQLGQNARMAICHALDNQVVLGKVTAAGALGSIDDQRREERQQAQAALMRLVEGHCANRPQLEIFIAYGDPSQEVVSRQAALPADLIVLGKRQRSFLDDVLQRTTGHKVVAAASGDVLVLPLDPLPTRRGPPDE